jgi:hypothetical protein
MRLGHRSPFLAFGASAVLGAGLALGVSGCRDLERWELSDDETFCGSLVSAPLFQEGLLPEGTPPALRMRLDLDVQQLATRPGHITTDDASRGLCRAEGKALFDTAPLRTVAEALHDPISTASLGEGRDQNVFAYVDSSCGHNMLAVVSLMSGGDVEVRLFKPAAEPGEGTAQADRPGFGLFVLSRKPKSDCGF